MIHPSLPEPLIERMVRAALLEATSRAVVPPAAHAASRLVAREAGVISGLQVAAPLRAAPAEASA